MTMTVFPEGAPAPKMSEDEGSKTTKNDKKIKLLDYVIFIEDYSFVATGTNKGGYGTPTYLSVPFVGFFRFWITGFSAFFGRANSASKAEPAGAMAGFYRLLYIFDNVGTACFYIRGHTRCF